jgi:hypothetical protein
LTVPKASLNDLVAYLRTVFPDPGARDLTDAELLQQFLKHHEETAWRTREAAASLGRLGKQNAPEP